MTRLNKFWPWVVLAAVLLLAAFLRFANLRTSPGWFTDEGDFIVLGQHLLEGRWQIFAIQDAPLLIQRPPLFLYLLTFAFRLLGPDIWTLRALCAACGLVSVALLYAAAVSSLGPAKALAAAALLAIFPWAAANSRLGFTYNLSAPLVLLALLGSLKLSQPSGKTWLVVSCLAAGASLATDFLGITAVLALSLILLIEKPRWFLPGLGLMLTLPCLLLAPILLSNPAQAWSDLHFIQAYKASAPPFIQAVNLIINSGEWVRRESWLVLGLAGLFMLPAGPLRRNSILFFLSLLLPVLAFYTPAGYGLHYLIPIFPLAALGIACFFWRTLPAFAAWAAEIFPWRRLTRLAAVLASLLACFPLLWMLLNDISLAVWNKDTFFTGSEFLYLAPPADYEAAANYVSAHAARSDLVIASPQIIWAVQTDRKSTWSISLTCDGADAGLVPEGLVERIAYPCQSQDARYIILDALAREFNANFLPGLRPLITQVEDEWQQVFSVGNVEVYANPLRNP
ncbi:MAG TPA: glycosyltransferase family 39 protein [Anaerolineaceae bacterium]|nr:glycosyltransferase family 39 protein [Anaerolineaceae bacterium]HPN51439.1 glycosyltransferase family 39 protein [Anaerolineaceae bacterium]